MVPGGPILNKIWHMSFSHEFFYLKIMFLGTNEPHKKKFWIFLTMNELILKLEYHSFLENLPLRKLRLPSIFQANISCYSSNFYPNFPPILFSPAEVENFPKNPFGIEKAPPTPVPTPIPHNDVSEPPIKSHLRPASQTHAHVNPISDDKLLTSKIMSKISLIRSNLARNLEKAEELPSPPNVPSSE